MLWMKLLMMVILSFTLKSNPNRVREATTLLIVAIDLRCPFISENDTPKVDTFVDFLKGKTSSLDFKLEVLSIRNEPDYPLLNRESSKIDHLKELLVNKCVMGKKNRDRWKKGCSATDFRDAIIAIGNGNPSIYRYLVLFFKPVPGYGFYEFNDLIRELIHTNFEIFIVSDFLSKSEREQLQCIINRILLPQKFYSIKYPPKIVTIDTLVNTFKDHSDKKFVLYLDISGSVKKRLQCCLNSSYPFQMALINEINYIMSRNFYKLSDTFEIKLFGDSVVTFFKGPICNLGNEIYTCMDMSKLIEEAQPEHTNLKKLVDQIDSMCTDNMCIYILSDNEDDPSNKDFKLSNLRRGFKGECKDFHIYLNYFTPGDTINDKGLVRYFGKYDKFVLERVNWEKRSK